MFDCVRLTLVALVISASAAQAQITPPVPNAPNIPTPDVAKRSANFKDLKDAPYRNVEEDAQREGKSVEEIVQKLLDEFGPNAYFGTSKHFIYIYDVTNYFASWVALLSERVENVYEHFAKYLGVGMTELKEPMVVIIFTNEGDFVKYMTKNDPSYASRVNKPVGVYIHGTERNCAVFYDITQTDRTKTAADFKNMSPEDVVLQILAHPQGKSTLTTIIHEVAHQVSYNRGLFNRLGKSPTWAVEGLAMLFEAPVGGPEVGGWKVTSDFGPNLRRIMEFQQYAGKKQNQGGIVLRNVVCLEDISGDTEGSYALSWALFSYLYKCYPDRLAKYLYGTATTRRDSYTRSDRIADFEYCFTNNWDRLWMEVCAFVNMLETNPDSFSMDMNREPKKKQKKSKKTDEKKKEESDETEKGEGESNTSETPDDPVNGESTGKQVSDAKEKKNKTGKKSSNDSRKTTNSSPLNNATDAEEKKPTEDKTPEPAPEPEPEPVVIEGETPDDSPFDWNKYKGKIVLVSFWATFSKDAKAETERLVKLYEKYRGAGLEFVGYSLDDDKQTLREYLDEHAIPWINVFKASDDCENMADRYDIYKLPDAVLVDKNGLRILEKDTDGKNIKWIGDNLDRKLKELFPDVQ